MENAIRFGNASDLEALIASMEKMLAPAILAAASLDATVAILGSAEPPSETMVGYLSLKWRYYRSLATPPD